MHRGLTFQWFVVSISGWLTILVEACCEYLCSGYRQKLIDYPSFDLRLIKRCLQRRVFSVFDSLEGLAKIKFFANRLKGAETRYWMSSRPALRKAILSNDFGMPHLMDIVANIIGVWSLTFSYLKETVRKDDRASHVVMYSFFSSVSVFSYICLLYLWCLEERNGRVLLSEPNGALEVPSAVSFTWNL